MKTYLITGGAGFIGSHLCEKLLKSGNRVINIDNFCDFYSPEIKIRNLFNSLGKKSIEEFKGKSFKEIKDDVDSDSYKLYVNDIRDINAMEEIFKENKIDGVIHLAAMAGVRPSIENPILYEEVNVKGTMNILEMCKKYGIKKFICASSSSVYGNNEKVPFSENDIVDFAISPYAATKKSCEIIGHSYYHLYNIDMIMLRFFTVFGPRQRPDLAIHKFTKIIESGKELPFYGDGTTERDYTYIEDIMDGILKSIKYIEENSSVYEILNLGESRTITLSKMVKTIEDALGIKANIKRMEMQPGDVNRTFADITKAKKLIGYNPQTKFEDGIDEFVKWYKNNK
jgi:UDP-glucuronate 4-epimerase